MSVYRTIGPTLVSICFVSIVHFEKIIVDLQCSF